MVPLGRLAPRRVALVKPSALGDIVHALPVLSALRARFPHAAITWVVNKSYEPLLAGHPVLAWVALAEGPYAEWTSPAGRPIKVDYGEHAVVLTGVDAGSVKVNDPLSGERLTWSKSRFERMWAGLGRRALRA